MPAAPSTKNIVYVGWADKREIDAQDAKKMGYDKDFRKMTFVKEVPVSVEADFADLITKKAEGHFKIVEEG